MIYSALWLRLFLKEEVERLKNIKESEREIDWWSQSLPAFSLRQPAEAP